MDGEQIWWNNIFTEVNSARSRVYLQPCELRILICKHTKGYFLRKKSIYLAYKDGSINLDCPLNRCNRHTGRGWRNVQVRPTISLLQSASDAEASFSSGSWVGLTGQRALPAVVGHSSASVTFLSEPPLRVRPLALSDDSGFFLGIQARSIKNQKTLLF